MSTKSPTRGPGATGYLHNLCSHGNIPAIKQFLRDVKDMQQLEEQVGFLGYTPLHEAINQSQVAVVKLLLLHGADANAKANGFYTPLHMAASMDNLDCVELLLKHGADITCKDEFQKRPYETAQINKCSKAAKLLKSEEIKIAARENSPDLKETLKSIRSKDIMPTCFQDALLAASQKGHVSAINDIILAARKEELKLKSCLGAALQFTFYKAAAVLLVCYAALRELKELMRFLMCEKTGQHIDPVVLEQLPHRDLCEPALKDIRAFLNKSEGQGGNRKGVFQVAVPIKLALRHKKKESVKVLLHCTNCNRYQKEIEWRKLALGEVDPSWLEDIDWVEKLYLSSNLLSSVPSNITDLKNLCRLELPSNQLKTIPAGILEMPCLKNLNLARNKLIELPKKCTWTSSLKYLSLSDNQLESLPKSMASSKLENLYLAKNNLYEVPQCVCEIITLQTLDLSENHRLTQLPVQMGRLTNITNLKLENLDQITDPPDYIKRSAAKTIGWLRATLRNAKGYYSMKLMLVGRAEQGKTTLMKRLMYEYNYNTNSPTNGISMEEFRYKKGYNHKEYMFKIWDFGGQEDYYATHQCFISTLALYLLVWNMEKGEQVVPELEGWLDTIAARAPGSNIIIVGTHLDIVRKDRLKYDAEYVQRLHSLVLEKTKQHKYRKITVHYIKEVSCLAEYRQGIDDLRNTIYDVATRLLKGGQGQVPVMGEYIAHSYLLLADLIQQTKEQKARDGKLPIMHRTEYEALVTETIRNDQSDIEDPSDVKEVTKFLHERGIIMHYDDPNQDLQDLFFIDPKWLCDLLAKVVTLKEVQNFIKNGILQKSAFPFVFQGERFPQECYPQFIRLLNRFQIACSLDAERVLVPSRLPEEKPHEATNKDLPFVTVKRIHSFPYMPYGFWSRFSARLLHYTKEMLNVTSDRNSAELRRGNLCYHSPFQFEPSCCSCPLRRAQESSVNSEKLVPDGEYQLPIDKPSASKGSAQCKVENVQEDEIVQTKTTETENEPSEPPTQCDYDEGTESEEGIVDDVDGYAGIAKFVYDDTTISPSRGGLLINGMWISSGGGSGYSSPRSDSDFCSSEDEKTDETSSVGGLYRPSVVRSRGLSHRKVRGGWRDYGEVSFKHSTDPGNTLKINEPEDLLGCSPKSDSQLDIQQRIKRSKKIFQAAEKRPVSPLTVNSKMSQDDRPDIADSPPGEKIVGSPPATTWFVDLETCSELRSDTSLNKVIKTSGSLQRDNVSSSRNLGDLNSESVNGNRRDAENGSGIPSQREKSGDAVSTVLDNAAPMDSTDGQNSKSDPQDVMVNGTVVASAKDFTSTVSLSSHGERERRGCSYEVANSEETIPRKENVTFSPSSVAASDDGNYSTSSSSSKSEQSLMSAKGNATCSETSSVLTNSLLSRSGVDEEERSLPNTSCNSDSDLPAEQQLADVDLDASQYSCFRLPEVFSDSHSSCSSEEDVVAELPLQETIGSSFDSRMSDSLNAEDSHIVGEIVDTQFNLVTPAASKLTDAGFQFHSQNTEPSTLCHFDSASHLTDCPCVPDFPVECLPPLSDDVSKLMDDGFLHCWLSGVCLHHPRLFFMVSSLPDPNVQGRHLIITEVSPNHIGRQVLNYIVDHIDTLIKEWYPNLAGTDGCDLLVQQFIPCIICERYGLEPHKFTFLQCQGQSELSDHIACPVHPTPCNLHHIAPDVMLHDVDGDLLITEEQLEYEESEASLLGKGGFGRVVRGKCREETVAMKFYARDENQPLGHYYEVRKELSVLRRVRQHPFLINIVGVCVRPLCLVLELAEKGSLTSSLFSDPPTLVPRVILFRVAFQVADALSFLHSSNLANLTTRIGVIYRDLKPENILVWSLEEHVDLNVKMIDFGTANFATSTGLYSVKGTRGFHAPEMLDLDNKEEYSFKVDVYSYAVLLYQLITRQVPFGDLGDPLVSSAVIRRERPEWKNTPVAWYGLPTMTELMLRCWLHKPTRRPTSEQIAGQVCQPAFQMLLGKQKISAKHSVRHACLVPRTHELWLGCDSHCGNKVLVYDSHNMALKCKFTIDRYQDRLDTFQIQCMHLVSPDQMLIAVRGNTNMINVYLVDGKYKCLHSLPFGENTQITSMTSNSEYLFVGLNEGVVRCIQKKQLKKAEKKRNDHQIVVGRYRILALAVIQDKLWVASSKYIFSYFTETGEMEQFDMEALWYGGVDGFEDNPQTQVSQLIIGFDAHSVWSTCRTTLTKWNTDSRQKMMSVDCAPIIRSLGSQCPGLSGADWEAVITCVLPTPDTVWVGTGSGHILIFSSDAPRMLTWFYPYKEVRTLSMCIGPGPCKSEQCIVISTGKEIRSDGLGACGSVVCPLTSDRVTEIADEAPILRKASEESRTNQKQKHSSTSSRYKFYVPQETSVTDNESSSAELRQQYKCAMLVWEVVSATVFARIESKSGREKWTLSD